AAAWGSCAVLALGPTLILGSTKHIPLAENWHGTKVSWLMPYTWLVHLPVLSGLREADRFALLGLVGAAVLAGAAIDWLASHAKPLIIAVAVLAVFEAGWSGNVKVGSMPTTMAALDRPIAADHSGSIVVDVPYGLRGGIPLFGSSIIAQEQLLATSDGHPRAISYLAWVPEPPVRDTRHRNDRLAKWRVPYDTLDSTDHRHHKTVIDGHRPASGRLFPQQARECVIADQPEGIRVGHGYDLESGVGERLTHRALRITPHMPRGNVNRAHRERECRAHQDDISAALDQPGHTAQRAD